MNELINLIKDNAFYKGEFKLANGNISPYYIDIRKITLSSKGLQLITKQILKALDGIIYDAIGGMTLGADPIIGSLLACTQDKRGFIVRKEAKIHGTKNLIEGNLIKNDKIIIIDDVITSGNSVLSTINAIQLDVKIQKIIAVVDRLEGSSEKFKKLGYEFESLLTIKDLQ